jgi:phytoene dehydrogenase-like protein
MIDHFSYSELPVLCKYFYPDGFVFDARGNREENIKAIALAFDEDESRVRSFFRKSEFIYKITTPLFLESPLKLKLLFRTRAFWKGIASIPLLPLLGNYTTQLNKYFKNPKTIQYFQRYATYNGSSPFKTPALMQLLPHVEQGIGGFIPDKGMFDITKQLYELAKRQGVEFKFNNKIKQILLDGNKAIGVETLAFEMFYSKVQLYSYLQFHPNLENNVFLNVFFLMMLKDNTHNLLVLNLQLL